MTGDGRISEIRLKRSKTGLTVGGLYAVPPPGGDTMNRIVAVLATAVLLVAGAAGTAVGGGPGSGPAGGQLDTTGTGPANETDAPGARLSGVVAVQGAEVDGELDGRAFGIAIARANSDAAKAAVVADEVGELERRLADLRERKRTLDAARENGTISEARYRAELAGLSARTAAVAGQLNRTQAASADLPAALLAERGVNASAIEHLRADARNLSGPEVAAVARSIAGPNPGRSLTNADDGPPGLQDAPGATNRSDAGPSPVDTGVPNGTAPGESGAGENAGSRNDGTGDTTPSVDDTPGGGPPANVSGPPVRRWSP